MSIDIKYLGLFSHFNGIDIQQTDEYIKVHGTTYIKKICEGHKPWMTPQHCHTLPVLMKSESSYNRELKNDTPPSTDKETYQIQRQHKLNYRQKIEELIYAMVTCCPDIAFSVTKLSQSSTNQSSIQYEAVKQIFYYINCTKHEGIYFWRTTKILDLPPSPTSHETESAELESKIKASPSTLKVAVNVD